MPNPALILFAQYYI